MPDCISRKVDAVINRAEIKDFFDLEIIRAVVGSQGIDAAIAMSSWQTDVERLSSRLTEASKIPVEEFRTALEGYGVHADEERVKQIQENLGLMAEEFPLATAAMSAAKARDATEEAAREVEIQQESFAWFDDDQGNEEASELQAHADQLKGEALKAESELRERAAEIAKTLPPEMIPVGRERPTTSGGYELAVTSWERATTVVRNAVSSAHQHGDTAPGTAAPFQTNTTNQSIAHAATLRGEGILQGQPGLQPIPPGTSPAQGQVAGPAQGLGR